jgi:hypothetical protein
MPTRIWKFHCMEDYYPGLWLRWLKSQCVAVGWPPQSGFHLQRQTKSGRGWIACRNSLGKISVGDFALVTMPRSRVGRIGEVIKLSVTDSEWDPLVPRSKELPTGEMGRRVFVRWDLNIGPADFDLIVKLPKSIRLTQGELRPTVSEIRSHSIQDFKDALNDASNWIGLFGKFAYEKALSDFISSYPHRLEDGLLPYPNTKIREKPFPDKSRLDVLLTDKSEMPVVVECKQHSPSIDDVKQLEKYMKHVAHETGKKVRGILVHGGTPKLHRDVSKYIGNASIEIVSYKLDIDFRKST